MKEDVLYREFAMRSDDERTSDESFCRMEAILCYTHAEAQTAVQNVLELSEARDGQSMARDI